jgi:molybdopterin molybdotransferase
MKQTPATKLEEALDRLDQALADTRLADASLAAAAAVGRVLALPAHSSFDLPPFDKSAMDGYALPASRPEQHYRVIGCVAAGQPPPSAPLEAGQAMRVLTGAAVPPGSSEVVRQEDVLVEGSTLRVLRPGTRNICLRGEDVRRGDLVLPAGHRLRPLDVANLIACGITEIRAMHRPRVAIITTGDELGDDPTQLRPGQIMNSNGPLLSELSREHGLEVVSRAHAADDIAQTCEALEQALDLADLVVVTGGVSVGDLDLVPAAFDRIGLEIHVAGLALKPGRPTCFATRSHRAVFGLPGNPVAVYLMFHLLVLRAAARIMAAPVGMRAFSLELSAPITRRNAERMELLPARLDDRGRIVLLPSHGSAHLTAFQLADGVAVLAQGTQSVAEGERIPFWSLGRLDP